MHALVLHFLLCMCLNFLSPISANSPTKMCFCMDKNGATLIVKNSSPTHEYAFPEFIAIPNVSDHAQIKAILHNYAIKGKAGKRLMYTSAEDRAVHKDRSQFYRIYVDQFYNNSYTNYDTNRIITDLKTAVRLLSDNPNSDYKTFMKFILENPNKIGLIKEGDIFIPLGSYLQMKIVLICTDTNGKVLFIPGNDGSHFLPEFFYNRSTHRWNSSTKVKRVIEYYGIIGFVYKRLCEEPHQNFTLLVYHVLAVGQNRFGFLRVASGHSRKTSNEGIWMTPEFTAEHLQGTKPGELYEIVRQGDYREQLYTLESKHEESKRRRQMLLENREEGSTSSADSDIADYESDIEDIYNVFKFLDIN